MRVDSEESRGLVCYYAMMTSEFRWVTSSNGSSNTSIQVTVSENLRADFACYIWPSSLLLTKLIMAEITPRIKASQQKLHFLELGCGVGLPGILLAKLGANIVWSDVDSANVVSNLSAQLQMNRIDASALQFVELDWTDPSPDIIRVLGAFIPIIDNKLALDYIIGADVLYDVKLFHPLVRTISHILDSCTPGCHVLITYQERDSMQTIQHLLEFYGLVGELIPKSSFVESVRIYKRSVTGESWQECAENSDSLFCFRIRKNPERIPWDYTQSIEEIDEILNSEIDWFDES
jgi:predicted nicotinamide N-methyase